MAECNNLYRQEQNRKQNVHKGGSQVMGQFLNANQYRTTNTQIIRNLLPYYPAINKISPIDTTRKILTWLHVLQEIAAKHLSKIRPNHKQGFIKQAPKANTNSYNRL